MNFLNVIYIYTEGAKKIVHILRKEKSIKIVMLNIY